MVSPCGAIRMLPFWRMTTVPDAGVDLGADGAVAEGCGWAAGAGAAGAPVAAVAGPERTVFMSLGIGGTGAAVPRMTFCGPPLS